MAVISVGGYSFHILPNTASWTYSMNIKSFETYGGRVTQLLACHIDRLSVDGYISQKGNSPSGSDPLGQWQGMREFEHNVKSIMSFHEQQKSSVQFDFPEVGWSGNVWLMGYSDVKYEPDIPAVSYKLSFDVDYGFEEIAAAAGDYGLKNIPDGVGWVRSVYNTPNMRDWETYKEALAAILDDVGTFTASNPLDFYKYYNEAKKSNEEGAVASVASMAASAVDLGISAAEGIGFLESHGIVKSATSYAGAVAGAIRGA